MSMDKACHERFTRLYILYSISKVHDSLAEGSLSINALLPIFLGNPKTPKATATLLPQFKGHSGAGTKGHQISGDQIYSTNCLLLLFWINQFCWDIQERWHSESLIHVRNKNRANVTLASVSQETTQGTPWMAPNISTLATRTEHGFPPSAQALPQSITVFKAREPG